MKAITFFTGIGMFDLGLHAAGFEIVAQVEIEEFCQDVLRARWSFFSDNRPPEIYGDIRTITGDDLPQGADLFMGGFPCPPFSAAGQRKGDEDGRNMWKPFFNIISDYKPRWVVLENVSAILRPISGKPAYALTVLNDLSKIGYNTSWDIIRADDCGLPHRRERWFCVAQLDNANRISATSAGKRKTYQAQSKWKRYADYQHTSSGNRSRRLQCIKSVHYKFRLDRSTHGITDWMDRPFKIAGRGEAQYEHEPPRLITANDYNTRFWSKRMHALGNGGIPQIAYNIGKDILKIEGK